jgi:hypothetical protein
MIVIAVAIGSGGIAMLIRFTAGVAPGMYVRSAITVFQSELSPTHVRGLIVALALVPPFYWIQSLVGWL